MTTGSVVPATADRAAAISRARALPVPRSSGLEAALDLRIVRWALGALGVLIILGAWELAVADGLMPEADIPRASTVLSELWNQMGTSEFWGYVGSTAKGAAIGLLIASVIGISVGIAIGASDAIWRALRPTIEFLRPVPGIAKVPVAAVIWGPATGSAVFLAAFACVWVMMIQTMNGVRSVDDVALMTAKSLRLSWATRVRRIYLPGALPYILTGVRIAIPIALLVAISAGILIGVPGLGNEIRISQSQLNLPKMYALVLASGFLGLAVTVLTGVAEKRLLRWHSSQRRSR